MELDTITEHNPEPQEQSHCRGEEPQDSLVVGSVETSNISTSQEEQADDMYGNLPVLREHQYGSTITSTSEC